MQNLLPSNPIDLVLEQYSHATRESYFSNSKGALLPERMDDDHLVNILRLEQRERRAWSPLIADLVFEVKRRRLQYLVVRRIAADYKRRGYAFVIEKNHGLRFLYGEWTSNNVRRWERLSFTAPKTTRQEVTACAHNPVLERGFVYRVAEPGAKRGVTIGGVKYRHVQGIEHDLVASPIMSHEEYLTAVFGPSYAPRIRTTLVIEDEIDDDFGISTTLKAQAGAL